MPPKPAHSIVHHPKRLLMDDLTMHLARYADEKRFTLVVMGNANTDLSKDDSRDLPQYQRMLTDLDLVSAAQSRWKANSLHFKTHEGDEVYQPSQIDYILVSKRGVSAVQAFGISAPDDLMIGFDHAIMLCDLSVVRLLELGERKPIAALPQRHKPQVE